MCIRDSPRSVQELQETSPKTVETNRLYVAPQLHDWPVYDPVKKAFVLSDGPPNAMSMIDMPKEDAESLAPLKLYCDFKAMRGVSGAAPVANIKKLSVIRAEWQEQPVRSSIQSELAKAAYAFLMEHNKPYAFYLKALESL